MYLLIKHLLSSSWVPAPVLRAQNTVIAKSSTQRLGRRGQARAGSVPVHSCLSASGTTTGGHGDRAGWGVGLLPVSGEVAGQTRAGRPIPGSILGLPPAP